MRPTEGTLFVKESKVDYSWKRESGLWLPQSKNQVYDYIHVYYEVVAVADGERDFKVGDIVTSVFYSFEYIMMGDNTLKVAKKAIVARVIENTLQLVGNRYGLADVRSIVPTSKLVLVNTVVKGFGVLMGKISHVGNNELELKKGTDVLFDREHKGDIMFQGNLITLVPEYAMYATIETANKGK